MSESTERSRPEPTETNPTAATGDDRTTAGETEETVREEWTDYRFDGAAKLETTDLDVHYGDDHAIKDISMAIPEHSVTALIGPSGCGKSTFLRCLNRMNDRINAARIEGSVAVDGEEIYRDGTNLVELRKRVGMVFQQPNPFPKSIQDNVAYGPRKHGDIDTGLLARLFGRDSKHDEDELVERSLRQAALWEEVEDRLDETRSVSRAANNSDSASRGVSPSTPKSS